MDDIEDSFFANLSQATIDSVIAEAKSARTDKSTTTKIVPTENEKNSANRTATGNEEPKEQEKAALDGQPEEVVSMEVCEVVKEVFGALPVVELVCFFFFWKI